MSKILFLFFCCFGFAQAKSEINLFAWSEYVPQEVIDSFSKETGIKVNYETYASAEEMLAKLLAGGSAYDLIQPPEYSAEALIKADLLRPLNPEHLPNLKNIGSEFLHQPHDPDQKYTVPYMTGTVGIVVNTAKITIPIRGFRDVFQGKYRNRIVVVNDNREIVSWAFAALDLPMNELSAANLAKARPLLAGWLPQVKVFDSDSPKTALLNGDVEVGVVWSGEAALLWNENKKFKYVLPVEGAHMFIDLLAIPKTAPHPNEAERFIDYILRPEVSALISKKFPYTNPNLEARKLLSAEQLANPASYPPVGKLDTFRDVGKGAAAVDRLVTDLKSAP
ncbi:MAG TPA: spermidine/putrescine ABC transporter substrate-binding protein [Opitutaceae bacterium]|nr:spermidine/putrescine ABC transporter substrate-binding protein [Opitutaceae bacterium]